MFRRTKPMDLDDGVVVEPTPITSGQRVRVKYSGHLSNGAEEMYLHMGFGVPHMWQEIQEVVMQKGRNGAWEATLELPRDEDSSLNMCFRDSQFNWDNNEGLNWIYDIHNGKTMR